MIKTISSGLAVTLLLGACVAQNSPDTRTVQMSDTSEPSTPVAGSSPAPVETSSQIFEHKAFESAFVQPRNISVWVPADYSADTGIRYPVIYAHDGQNLFEADTSYAGAEWAIDETADRMMIAADLPPAIIVGIWNTDRRWQEYAPQKVIESLSGDTSSEWLGPTLPDLEADAYLRFITEELKPFIDATYATSPGADDTMIMGSSMGGLISLYAVAEYPNTFSRAAAVSTHWPMVEPDGPIARQADAAMQAYLETSGLDNARHVLWFDNGTETLDAAYPPHAAAMEAWFRAHGWSDEQAIFRAYPGTDHSEGAWAERVDDILTFLLAE